MTSALKTPLTPSLPGTPGGGLTDSSPAAPRDLLADASYLRALAREYAAMDCWSISAALDRAAILTEQLHEVITARRSRRSGTSPFFLEGQDRR